jgi:tetrapyrrole methylase family protein/MazG family protein
VARRPHVVVVGLGPAGTDLFGPDAAERLRDRGRTWLRTGRHPAAAALEGANTFDDVYDSAGTFDEVYAAIVERLIAAAETASPEPVVYAVPGSPLVCERTVELLREDERVEVTIVPALSFLDLAWTAVGVDPLAAGVRLVDAADFADVTATERGPFLVAQCWSRHLLSGVKLLAGDDAGAILPRPVLLHHLGLPDEVVAEVDWWELDRTLEPDHLTSLYVPRFGDAARRGAGAEMARLVGLMDTLRERCPWDRAQDHASLMPHLVEECYEVLDALSALSAAPVSAAPAANIHLEEELGDLLFQIVFHARLGAEDGFFDMAGVARTVHDKLVHRHPHVFGDVAADDAGQVMANWEEIKRTEKGRTSVTEGIPAALPALVYASKLARKARSVGVEPQDRDASGAAADLAALARRAERSKPHPDDPLVRDERVERQIGDLLFAIVNIAQRVGVDAEQALRERALVLRDDIRRAEGVPDGSEGSR